MKTVEFVLLSLLSCWVGTVYSFGIVPKPYANQPSLDITRAGFVQSIASAAVLLITPKEARADITNKLASKAALRNVKSAQKKLASIELYVANNDYASLKLALREAPLSDIRKACTTLVKGGEDGPDADKLQLQYKKFMTSLEKIDALASLGMRGRNISNQDFYSSYKGTVDTLASFLDVAREAIEIPIQYTD
mmetsp:Transcript_16179/g.21163  ORF Transcript_16179/g.21163 Transcript_16179/m.21163 type:complete len:193 (-) Transcript_16179:211-789(-)|eukprot:CAMPEP_0198145100 /NCGR_PEP_ID=MMETSP1443-20131203/21044_1 /TAXON_ID=186043 /ORGANISM="Entomoneis sp., Strain CCMP2396" /LENGTH=192 /DNA_ID=CAMNT_0043808629 /DNA_START=83 /DNA_END=661 /DNA_ORIENTATION=-